jgi:hypothetical protein
VEMDASGYAMGVGLVQGGKLVCYHFEMFHGRVVDYPTYEKELFAFVQAVNKWNNYMIVKETIIHIDH